MKKTTSFLLTLALLLSGMALLVSCAHTCTFEAVWSHDDNNHWHACEDEECVLTDALAAHTWDEGAITTKATQEAEGVKTYTCTVCAVTKTEPIVFTGMTEDEWNAIIHPDSFKNFTMDLKMVISVVNPDLGADMKFNSTMIMKFTENAIYLYAQSAGETMEETMEGDTADNISDIVDMLDYDNFTYDAEAKLYRAKGKVTVPWDNSEPSDVTIRFENGKLVEMKYSHTETEADSGLDMDYDNTVSFIDYGTTVIPNS